MAFFEIKNMYISRIIEKMKNLEGELSTENDIFPRAIFKEFGESYSVTISLDYDDKVCLFSGIGCSSFDNKSEQSFIIRKYCACKKNDEKAKKIAELKRQLEELEK